MFILEISVYTIMLGFHKFVHILCLIFAHHTLDTFIVHLSHCHYLLYSLQYNIDGLLDATGKGQLEDIKKHLQIGVNVNESAGWVNNYIYTYFIVLNLFKKFALLKKGIGIESE